MIEVIHTVLLVCYSDISSERSEPFWHRMVCIRGVLLLPLCLSCTLSWQLPSSLSRCNVSGVEQQFKLGGRLVGERSRKPNSFVQSKCLFADDADVACSSEEDMALAVKTFDKVATRYGLALSVSKTKLLVAGLGLTNDLAPLELKGGSD